MDSSSVLPTFVILSTANALIVASMSSPRRQLAEIGSPNSSNYLRMPKRCGKQQSTSNWLGSLSKRSVTSPTKCNMSTVDAAQDVQVNKNDGCTQQGHARNMSPQPQHSSRFATTSPKSPPSQRVQPPSLMHSAKSPLRIHLDPRVSNVSQSNHKSDSSQCSYTEEPKSILHPRGIRHITAGSASSNDSNSYTMTPTVMFSKEVEHQQIEISSKRHDQQYHQSPHWTGKVRINPFSPVPPKYLQPPGSMSSYFGFPALDSQSLSPLHLPTKQLGMRRSRRLKPKSDSFPSTVLEDNVSPTDVTEDPFGINIKSPCKRKPTMLDVPQSVTRDIEQPNKQPNLNRSRYLEDFEEVRHLGSGSFGSVNACLSRLDGCMYAIKSVSPQGIQRSNLSGYNPVKNQREGLYGGHQSTSLDLPSVPPTPRRDVVLSPMKKRRRQFKSTCNESEEGMDGGMASGIKHWTESALRRMLREVR
jgi:hypothetical protein